MFSSLILSLSLPLSITSLQICEQDPCNFTPLENEIYGCGCGVSNCLLTISNTDGKNIEIYTYAKSTTIICQDKDSCQNALILPGYDSSLFNLTNNCPSNSPKKVQISCNAETSCKDMNITSNNIPVTVEATITNSFDESILECIGINNNCLLNCGNIEKSCENALCLGKCNCFGKYCPGYTSEPTKSPSIEVNVAETEEPTRAEVDIIDYVRCNGVGNKCVLKPKRNDIILVNIGDNIELLEIVCNGEQQCLGVVVYSSANNTKISCGDFYQSCIDVILYIGDFVDVGVGKSVKNGVYNSALVECLGEDSCKEMKIEINGNFNTEPLVIASGHNAFSEGQFICEFKQPNLCKLLCNTENGESCDQSVCNVTCIRDEYSSIKQQKIITSFNENIVNNKNNTKFLSIVIISGLVVIFIGMSMFAFYYIYFRKEKNVEFGNDNNELLKNAGIYNTFSKQDMIEMN